MPKKVNMFDEIEKVENRKRRFKFFVIMMAIGAIGYLIGMGSAHLFAE